VAEEVERHPLAGEDRASGAGHLRHQAALAPLALLHVRVPAQAGVDPAEDALRRPEAGDHARGLLLDAGAGERVGGHHGNARGVAGAEVLA
jgi:hypothetical protein